MSETQDTQNVDAPSTDRTGRSFAEYLEWGALAALVALAVVATFRFYLSASRAIDVWLNPGFEPIFQAAFNLVVLLGAGVGVSLLVRRLTGE